MEGNLLRLARFLIWGPLYGFLILVDRYVFRSRNPFLRIPRTVRELLTPRDRIFHLLREHHILPTDARWISCVHQGGAETEPDKNVARLDIAYSTPTSSHETAHLFVKLPTARQHKILIEVLSAVLGTGSKEITFYNVVLPELERQAGGRGNLGFAVPKNLLSTWSRPFGRAILIQECVDMSQYHTRPDWKNADAPVVQRIIDSATDLHRRTWQLRDVSPTAVGAFREEGGVDWVDGMMSRYVSGTLPSIQGIWNAIKKRTAKEPITISHGDCRLGNCLFTSDFSEVILTDWEVNSVTFYLWDVSYCMLCSFTPEDRRKHEQAIIRRYLDAIRENPANADVPSFESAMELHRISLIIVQVFGWLISRFGGVGKAQGNSDDDVRSWQAKMKAGVMDAVEDEEGLARALDVDVSLVRQFREDYVAGKILNWEDGLG